MYNDTIVAISTALGKSAISIVRLSGPEAIEIANKVFKGPDLSKVSSHTIHYGKIIDGDEIIDEVLVSVFRAPKTFTREDVVEINCHGGMFVTNKILELLLLKGARLAEAGEFTKRAFLNGRIDLTQAEAVMDIIEAQTTNSLKMANYGLTGQVKKMITNFRQKLLNTIARIEVNIDYPEYEDEYQITNDYIVPVIKELLHEINVILKRAEVSKIMKEGISTAIIGKPNVGKSSLLNALLREERAIVTDIAGTTRDFVEGSINLGGLVLNLIDTAGIRKTEDIVEQIGVKKTHEIIEQAQLLILVFDYSSTLTEEDLEILRSTEGKKRIIVINKRDLKQKIDLSLFKEYLLVSSFNDEDIEILEKKIKEVCNIVEANELDYTYIGNARQIAKLKQAYQYLLDAQESIKQERPIDIIGLDLTNAWNTLGEIIGEVGTDQLINELFSQFCLGK